MTRCVGSWREADIDQWLAATQRVGGSSGHFIAGMEGAAARTSTLKIAGLR